MKTLKGSNMETTEIIQDEECDVESVGEALIEGLTEILETKKKVLNSKTQEIF